MTAFHSTMRVLRIWIVVAASCANTASHAQTSILPQQCSGKTGDALDLCVRDLTLPQIVPKLEFAAPVHNPAQLVNCTAVHKADQVFCVARNEIIIECRKQARHPDFDACFADQVANVARPALAACQSEQPVLRKTCAPRNAEFSRCLDDPLRYFQCLAGAGGA